MNFSYSVSPTGSALVTVDDGRHALIGTSSLTLNVSGLSRPTFALVDAVGNLVQRKPFPRVDRLDDPPVAFRVGDRHPSWNLLVEQLLFHQWCHHSQLIGSPSSTRQKLVNLGGHRVAEKTPFNRSFLTTGRGLLTIETRTDSRPSGTRPRQETRRATTVRWCRW